MKQLLFALLACFTLCRAEAAFVPTKTPVSPGGAVAIIDLPTDQHMRNKGGSDGYGLCVNTSIETASRWQNVWQATGLQEWSTHRPGGSIAEQVVTDLKAFAAEKKVTIPAYVQHTGGDDAFLELIYKTRRMPCMTYAGEDDFYHETIAHMVNGAYLDGKDGAIIDNNRPGNWVWMTRTQKLNRWKGLDDKGNPLRINGLIRRGVPVGGGWVFCWLNPPPPPLEGVSPKPAPLPMPRQVRWDRQVFAQGRIVWFCWEGKKLLGVHDEYGWHRALSNDSWEQLASQPPEGIRLPEKEPPLPIEPGPLAPCPGPNCPWRYWVNGIETTRAAAFAALADPTESAPSLVDDSDKYHLSIVVADNQSVEPIVQSWFDKGGRLERFASKTHVQVYSKDSWVTRDRLRKGLTIQEPAKRGGKRVYEYTGDMSAKDLETVLASIFDPKPVDPPKPEPAPAPKPVPAPAPAPVPAPINPPAPVPAPAPEKSWLSLLIAFLVALFWRKSNGLDPADSAN